MDPWSSSQVTAVYVAAGLLFLLEIVLAIAIVAVGTVSRVALQRLSNGGSSSLGFLSTMRDPSSSHRMAAGLMRLLALLGGMSLVVLATRSSGVTTWTTATIGAATLIAVLTLDLLIPRLVALWNAKAALRAIALPLRVVNFVLYPVVVPLSVILAGIGRRQEANEDEREEEQDEEVEALIEVGEREGILEGEEGEMMRSIVDLDETIVREIMTPRTDIVALPLDTSVADARRRILEAGHSRLPVYRDTMDDVVGILHERELLRAWEQGQQTPAIQDHLREAMLVPETLSVADLLAEMRVKSHIAIVVDEYGGVSGLVTLEDLLEEIVGDIREEHDLEEEEVQQQDDGSWIMRAATHVEELEERFGLELGRRDFDTVGGLVVSQLGRVPEQGETLRVDCVEIEVLEADARRIHRVRVRPVPSNEAQTGG